MLSYEDLYYIRTGMPGMGAIMIYKAHDQVSVIPLLLIRVPHFICVPVCSQYNIVCEVNLGT